MKYVLDANVALKWVLPESDSDKATRIRDDFLKGIHELLCPDVLLGEVGHSLTRMERRGLIQPVEGVRMFSDILATLPIVHLSLPISARAYEISSDARHGYYDCLYVALAEREGCSLLTADQKLIAKLARIPIYHGVGHIAVIQAPYEALRAAYVSEESGDEFQAYQRPHPFPTFTPTTCRTHRACRFSAGMTMRRGPSFLSRGLPARRSASRMTRSVEAGSISGREKRAR